VVALVVVHLTHLLLVTLVVLVVVEEQVQILIELAERELLIKVLQVATVLQVVERQQQAAEVAQAQSGQMHH
jgi:hypothetical protein